MLPITTTENDYQMADAESGAEIMRLRRTVVVMTRRITELEAENGAISDERDRLLEQLRDRVLTGEVVP